MVLYNSDGRAYELADGALGLGREGSVYRIVGEPLVAKVYHNPTPETARKIEAMAAILSVLYERKKPLLLQLAWPFEALYERADGLWFKGFLMYEVPEGYVSIDAVSQFPANPAAPSMTERQKIKMLINLCNVTAELHDIGITLGDWNPRNFLVGEQGSLMLLDTDSYGFTLSDVSYQTTCAAPGYIAPEVLKLMETTCVSDFESLAAATNAPVFTPQTDDFGLAVHIFKMLNRGVHPYSGDLDLDFYDLDDDDIPPAPSLNTCIRSGQSPFIGTSIGYAIPDYALRLDDFGGLMGEAFRRSLFGKPEERLDARTWARLLDRYLSETIECAHGHLYHFYHSLQGECPYCRGERALLARLS